MKSYFGKSSSYIEFDFRAIRPKGSLLITSGGKAPGSGPLRECLARIQALLDGKNDGDKLTTIEAHSILCHIADAVLSGGIRRASLIALFSVDDNDMLAAKTGNWWEINPHFRLANNSVVMVRSMATKEDFDKIWEYIKLSGSGEPGIMWTNNPEVGANPCMEISLKNMQMCNLLEINASDIKSQDDFNERCWAASLIGTLQASYTDFHYLRDDWKKNCDRDALIGVSMTGIASMEVFNYNIEEAVKVIKDTNEEIAKIIGINKASRTTCVKPAGTTSLVLGTSSGIHAWHDRYYWRRMRINKNESIYTYLLINNPELLEDDFFDSKNTAIIKVPQKAPDNSVIRTETALNLLERVKVISDRWISTGHIKGYNHNNVSCTISVKDGEWDEVKNWMWNNRKIYNGIAVLPHSDHVYKQPPFESCTKEEYEVSLELLKNIDLSKVIEIQDNTTQSSEVACGGGACEIV